jgi:hypothetical protein
MHNEENAQTKNGLGVIFYIFFSGDDLGDEGMRMVILGPIGHHTSRFFPFLSISFDFLHFTMILSHFT